MIAIIAILASLLLPALSRAKAQAQKAICLNNFKELHLAWHMYIDDNNGHLPYNDLAVGAGEDPQAPNWVAGMMQWQDDWKDNTNTVKLIKPYGGIGPYLKEPSVFKCPSDKSQVKIKGTMCSRVRSIAMNEYMGTQIGLNPNGDPEAYHYATLGNLVRLPEEMGLVFIDTHEDSIVSGMFQFDHPYVYWWDTFPASRHNGAATLSFTDGHVVCHKWLDSRTRQPVTRKGLYGIPQPGNQDILWLQLRASQWKPGVVPHN